QLSIGDRFASHRKQRMFRAVLALMGSGTFEDCREDDFALEGSYQTWLRTEMIALKVLHAVHLEHPAWIKAEDISALTEVLRLGSSREHMVVRRILALFALRSIPGHGSAVRTGIECVLAVENPDGGLPCISGLEIFCTAVAGFALAGEERDSRGTLARMA